MRKSTILPPDPVFCFKKHMGHIHSLCFVVKNETYCPQILAATEKGVVHFWDLETNRLHYKQAMGESIQAVHHFKDNVITQEKSGLVKLWSVENSSYKDVCTYQAGGGFCKSDLFNGNLMLPQENGAVDILEVNSLSKVQRLVPDQEKLGMLMCLKEIEVDGTLCLLGGYESGDVILWDLGTFKQRSHIKLQECLTSLTFDAVRCRAICSGASDHLQLISIDKSYNMTLRCELAVNTESCNFVKIRPDGRIFVSGGQDGKLRIFSSKTLRTLVVLTEHKVPVTDVQFSPVNVNFWNSKIMAVSDVDGKISMWNIYN